MTDETPEQPTRPPVTWEPPPERVQPAQPLWGPSAPQPTTAWQQPGARTIVVIAKDRLVAIVLALFLGSVGMHKFYLGKVGQGIIYAVFFWTYIPTLIGWIEAIRYLMKSDEAWAAEYGGPVVRPNSTAIGCLWALAILPLLGIIAVISLVFLGSQVSDILSRVGNSIR